MSNGGREEKVKTDVPLCSAARRQLNPRILFSDATREHKEAGDVVINSLARQSQLLSLVVFSSSELSPEQISNLFPDTHSCLSNLTWYHSSKENGFPPPWKPDMGVNNRPFSEKSPNPRKTNLSETGPT